jgi:hypothetical protein
VPDTAILSDQDKRYVLIVVQNVKTNENEVARRNVSLGAVTDDGLRVIRPADTLEVGDDPTKWQVIVDNLQRARLNYPVEIVTQNASAAEKK